MTYSLPAHYETIDLEDYGWDENTKWSDLDEQDKIEIKDILVEQIVISVSGEDKE